MLSINYNDLMNMSASYFSSQYGTVKHTEHKISIFGSKDSSYKPASRGVTGAEWGGGCGGRRAGRAGCGGATGNAACMCVSAGEK